MRPALCLIALFTSIIGLPGEEPFSFEKTPGKLPKEIVPRSYAIRIEPDLAKDKFRGSELIDIEVSKPVRQIVLNARGLAISRAQLGGQTLTPQLDEKKQTLTFALPSELAPGRHQLELGFSGSLGEQPCGLFIARYQVGQQKRRALATQMEPTDARRMFPCWDEPVFRATFELTAVVPASYTAVSNMPVASETALANGLKEVRFGSTPPMASYLMAFFAGEFEAIEGEVDGVELRVLTTPGKREQARYALEATKQILPFYNEYFGTNYPLPKLDQIALPGGGAGAMENWGAILYNDTALLYDPAVSSAQTKERVFAVIAHEIAHQWFGNLVTMSWWDNLWLNEGFASWMGAKATDRFNPEWQTWLRESGEKERAMALDARATTHPIQQPVATEDQANDAFDEITYSKGQAFIRMLENYLGAQSFCDGIRAYMQRHAYSSTTTADLWKALEGVSGKPVRTFAAGWTEQPGFPVVKVEEIAAEGPATVAISQERFTLNQPHATPLFWAIPIALGPAAAPLDARLVLLKETKLSPTPIEPAQALKANIGDVGYYRVWYDDVLFKRLRKASPLMAAADRLNLLSDVWAMAQAGRSPMARCFEIIDILGGDTSPTIIQRIIDICWTIHQLEHGGPGEAAFHTWACRLFQPHLERLGWDASPGEKQPDTLLRSSLIEILGAFGHAATRDEARRRFRAFITNGTTISGDLRRTVLKIIGRDADAETWRTLHDLGCAESSTEQKLEFYRALASAKSRKLANRTLSIALTDELTPDNATWLVHKVADDGEHPALAVEFARAHLDALLAKAGSLRMNSFVPGLYRSFTDSVRAEELETLAHSGLPQEAAYQVAKAADDIRFKAALKKLLIPAIDEWCRAQQGK